MEAPATPTTISASRVPAMLGMDSRCSPLTLFLRLRGDLPDEPDNEAMLQGRFYERATAEIACHKYGMRLISGMEQLDLHDGVLSGHPDFVAIDEHGKLCVLEVKNPFFSYQGDGWGDPGSDQVPRPYWIQSMLYSHLLRVWRRDDGDLVNAEVADYAYVIARLHGGVERFKVPFDADIVKRVRIEVERFLTRVQLDDPPDAQDEQDMRNRWPVTQGKVVDCNEAFVAQLRALQQTKAQIKALTEQESALKTIILGFLQDAEAADLVDHATGKRTRVVEASVNRSLDEQALIADHPDLLQRYPALDKAKLRKEQKGLVETYMRRPEKAVDQTRVIRIKLKEEETQS